MGQSAKLLLMLLLATLALSACGNKPTQLTLPENATTTENTNAN